MTLTSLFSGLREFLSPTRRRFGKYPPHRELSREVRPRRRSQFQWTAGWTDTLEDRVLLATAVWTNVAGGSWNVAANWSTNAVPGAGDDAVIDVPSANVTITHSTGSDTGLTIVLQHAPRRHMLTYPGCMAEMRYEDLDLAYLTSARHFHLSSFFLHRALRDRIPELFRQLKLAGLTISFDSNDECIHGDC